MNVLVTAASSHDATQEIAEAIGRTPRLERDRSVGQRHRAGAPAVTATDICGLRRPLKAGAG
jgi:hypothetical protein